MQMVERVTSLSVFALCAAAAAGNGAGWVGETAGPVVAAAAAAVIDIRKLLGETLQHLLGLGHGGAAGGIVLDTALGKLQEGRGDIHGQLLHDKVPVDARERCVLDAVGVGLLAEDKLEKDDAERVDVALVVVGFVCGDFGGEPLLRAADGHLPGLGVGCPREAKVADLHAIELINQNVFALQVAVNDVSRMQKENRRGGFERYFDPQAPRYYISALQLRPEMPSA